MQMGRCGNILCFGTSNDSMRRRTFLQLAATARVFAQGAKPAVGIPWTQWGGPHRNFQTEAAGLKEQWPAAGPKVVWKRPLGEGYSSPSVENNVLYTMYGKPREEVVLACDAGTGKTLWEHATPMTFSSDVASDMGNGPYSTALIVGDRMFTTGVAGRLQCIEKKSGKLLWTQQLWQEYKGTRLMYGYSSSPIAYRDTVIVPVGGPGRAVMAFKQQDGSVAWSRNDFGNAYSSPLLINVDGLEQMVVLMDGAVFAVNPNNGDLQWQTPFRASYGIAVATPVWGPGNLLFVSAEYDAGSKVIHLERNGLRTKATEVWESNRLRLHHGNAIRIGGTLYFSSGGKGSVAIFTAVDAASGKILWQDRSIGKATFVWADQKLITLDGDGNLMLVHPSPTGFKVAAKAELLTSLSWTPPTLVGTRLYVRDRRNMMAVELG
jgi:outer membrane protein assembly factor BamB